MFRGHCRRHCIGGLLPAATEPGSDATGSRCGRLTTERLEVMNRRTFVKTSVLGMTALGFGASAATSKKPLFKISLAEWSFNKALFGKKMDNLDFARTAKR